MAHQALCHGDGHRGDAVVTEQHFAENGMGTRVELRELGRLWQRSPTLRQRVASVRNNRANAPQ
jgi:hypothetical protein